MDTPSIGFIGTGKMAEALIGGSLGASLADRSNVFIFDRSEDRSSYISGRFGVRVCHSGREVCQRSTVIILAVKPQNMAEVLNEIRPAASASHLIISIAAGISIPFIQEKLGNATRIVRTMPNTPCLVGEGMTAVAPGPTAGKEDIEVVLRIFGAVGKAVEVSEDMINTVTALSGSGPAFFYEIADAFARAGEARGVTYDLALSLITQTMRGAAAMIDGAGNSIPDLISMVASPGGTTVAGLEVLQDGTLKNTIDRTVGAAKNRAEELSRGG